MEQLKIIHVTGRDGHTEDILSQILREVEKVNWCDLEGKAGKEAILSVLHYILQNFKEEKSNEKVF